MTEDIAVLILVIIGLVVVFATIDIVFIHKENKHYDNILRSSAIDRATKSIK